MGLVTCSPVNIGRRGRDNDLVAPVHEPCGQAHSELCGTVHIGGKGVAADEDFQGFMFSHVLFYSSEDIYRLPKSAVRLWVMPGESNDSEDRGDAGNDEPHNGERREVLRLAQNYDSNAHGDEGINNRESCNDEIG